MDTTKRIIEEAESLMDFLYDDVETPANPIVKYLITLVRCDFDDMEKHGIDFA